VTQSLDMDRHLIDVLLGLQMCIMLCADHGPCVSGAHNAIVTSRAGKDLVSSLVSGIVLSLARFEPIIFSGFVQGHPTT
jgi:citrate synthase